MKLIRVLIFALIVWAVFLNCDNPLQDIIAEDITEQEEEQ